MVFTKKEKRSKKERKLWKGRLVEIAAAVEIGIGCLRRLFLDDFHRCLKKPAPKTLRLFHRSHKPGGDQQQEVLFIFSEAAIHFKQAVSWS